MKMMNNMFVRRDESHLLFNDQSFLARNLFHIGRKNWLVLLCCLQLHLNSGVIFQNRKTLGNKRNFSSPLGLQASRGFSQMREERAENSRVLEKHF